MNTEWAANQVLLTGAARGEPVFSHQSHGEDFFVTEVESLRLSGTADRLNVLMTRAQLDEHPICSGTRLRLQGEVRSYNNRSGVGHRLVITMLARTIQPAGEAPDENQVALTGALCRAPVYRHTPLGREIADLMLAVNRWYGRADYIPCIAWGTVAQQCARLDVGALLRLNGRLQSRGYTKLTDAGPVEMTAYEVSVMTMEVLPLPEAEPQPTGLHTQTAHSAP